MSRPLPPLRYPLLFAPFAAVVALSHPFANVLAGGDDWVYAGSALTLLHTGRLELCPCSGPLAIPHIAIGALSMALFGREPLSLVLGVLAVAALGIPLLDALFWRLSGDRTLSALAAIFVSVSTLYAGLSLTFMSDMVYCVLMVAAVLAYDRARGNRSATFAILGGMLAGLAFLDRQIAVVLPIAVAAALLLDHASTPIATAQLVRILSAAIVVPAAVVLVYFIDPGALGVSVGYANGWSIAGSAMEQVRHLPRVLLRLSGLWAYLATSLLPLGAVLLLNDRERNRAQIIRHPWRVGLLSLGILASWIGGALRLHTIVTPGDVLHVEPWMDGGYPKVFVLQMAAALIPGGVLLEMGLGRIRDLLPSHIRRSPVEVRQGLESARFVVLVLLGHVVLSCIFATFFNNYFLPLLPLGAAALLWMFRGLELRRRVAVALVLAAVAVSVLQLEPTRRVAIVAWRVADGLEQAPGAGRVDGFSSWNGWRHHDLLIAEYREMQKRHVHMGYSEFTDLGISRSSILLEELPSGDGNAFPSRDSIPVSTYDGTHYLYISRRGPPPRLSR